MPKLLSAGKMVYSNFIRQKCPPGTSRTVQGRGATWSRPWHIQHRQTAVWCPPLESLRTLLFL